MNCFYCGGKPECFLETYDPVNDKRITLWFCKECIGTANKSIFDTWARIKKDAETKEAGA